VPDVFDQAAANPKKPPMQPIAAHQVRDVFDEADAETRQAAQPTISARKPDIFDRVVAMFREAVPQFSTKTVYHPTYGRSQLIEPEAALTPSEQARHPIATGITEFAGGLTSPENTAILAATGGLGTLPGLAGRLIPRLVAAGFSAMMIKGVYDQVPEFKRAMDEGNESEALRIFTHMTLGGAMATLAGRHAAGAETPMVPAYLKRAPVEAPVSARPAPPTEAVAPPEVAPLAPRTPAAPAVPPERPVATALKPESVAPPAKPDVFDQAAAPRTVSEITAQMAELERKLNRTKAAPIQKTLRGQMDALAVEKKAAIQRAVEINTERDRIESARYTQTETARIAAAEASPEASARRARTEEIAAQNARQQEVFAAERAKGYGKPAFSSELYRGQGATLEQVYGKEAVEQGRAYPIFGKGSYYAENPKAAERYGKVTKETVELKNPLVIDSDTTWLQLVRDAETPHLSSVNPEFYKEATRIPEMAEKMQAYIKAQGYDGVIVRIPEEADVNVRGERVKRLGETFEHSQIVKFAQAKPSANIRAAEQPKPIGPVAQAYAPDVLEDASALVNETVGKLASLEKPGVYWSETAMTERGEAAGREGSKPFIYGIKSHFGDFPWLQQLKTTLKQANAAMEKGKGADYERLMHAAAREVTRQREQARPIIEEYRPELERLAGSLADADPDLARTLTDIAAGRYSSRNVRQYIEEKLTDAQTAARLSLASDKASVEESHRDVLGARPQESAATEEPPARQQPPAVARNILPGMEEAVARQKEAAGVFQGEKLTAELRAPLEKPQGEIEKSPLFRGTEAVPQKEMFAPVKEPKGPSGGAYGEPYELRPGRVVLPKVQQVNAPRELIGKGEIVRQLSEGLDKLPIRVGHFKQKALGIYKTKEESVRLLKALDIQTTFHEAGHHINKLLWGTYSKKTNAYELDWKPLAPFRSELKPPNFGYRPSGRSYLPESFADFVAAYVIDPATAKAKAPKFYEFFEKELNRTPDVRDVLEDSRANVLRWLEQPAQARILAHISKEETPVPQNRFDHVMTATVDALRPLQNVVNELARGQKVPTEQNAYELARLLAGWAGKAEHFLERGTFKAGSLEVTGKSLKAILEPFEGKLDDLRVYLTAKRAVEKAAQGKASGLEVDDMVTALKELETPQMKKVAQELYDYNDATLRYLKDSGYFSEEQYRQILSMNQNYVPFYRVMEEAPGAPALGGGKTLAGLWNPVKRMKGSGQEIIDPLESIVKNTYTFINLAERNRVALALARQADSVEGAGKWIEEVPAPQRATKFELEEIKKALIQSGVEVTLGPDGVTLLGAGGKELDLDTMALVFRPSGIAPKGENILTVRDNGKSRFYQVHPDLYRSLKALDQDQSNILVKILSAPARLLRLGATGLSPEFILRNPVRDAWTAWLQSKNGFVPGVDSLRGLFHALKRDDLYWEWKRAGGEHAALVAMDRSTLQGELKDLMRSPLFNVVRHPIEAARQLSEWTEAATRVGEYGKARKAGKTPRQAALESREVTVDFARVGNSTRAVNSIIAFWNAAVQGTDKFARTHIENPRGTVVKALVGVTLPSILLYMANRKDKDYQELPRWQKDFFWMVPTGNTKTPFVRIPKPFLWGMVYGSTVERTLEWIDRRDPRAFDELFGNIATSAGPSLVPTAAVPIVEAYANRSLFRDAPLDPRYLEKVTPEYRVTDRTSLWAQKTALALAKTGIHISPNKLDNALFGYTGGLGTFAVRGTEAAIFAGKRPSLRPSDMPLLRGFAVSAPGRESQSVQQFYDRLEELEQKQGTLAYDRRYPGRLAGPPELSLAEKQELYRLRYANTQMQEINQQIRRTSSDPKLSPNEKRTKLDELNARAVATTRKALRKDQPTYRMGSVMEFLQQGVRQ
jgi:hypothetical protein